MIVSAYQNINEQTNFQPTVGDSLSMHYFTDDA